jgi:hypothetical protein
MTTSIFIHGFPATRKGPYDNDYTLELITKDNVFYGDLEEGDDNANTIILNREGELLSDNYFASSALVEELNKPLNDASFVWQSEEFKENHKLHKEQEDWSQPFQSSTRHRAGFGGKTNSMKVQINNEETLIESVTTAHTGGDIWNDVIVLKDGTVIRISEGAVTVSVNEDDDHASNNLGVIFY